MSLNNLRIGFRLGASFGVLLLLLGVVAALAVLEIRTLKADLDTVVQEEREAALAEDWMWAVRLNDARMQAVVSARDVAQSAAQLEPLMRQTSEQIGAIQTQLQESVTSPAGKEQMAKLEQVRNDYIAARNSVLAAIRAGDAEGGIRLTNERLLPVGQRYIDAIGAMVSNQRSQVDAFMAKANADGVRAQLLMLSVAALALLFGIGVAIWTSRSITRPVGVAVEELDSIAHGDLSRSVQVDRQDEIGSMQKRLAEMQTALQRVVLQIREASDGVALSASEIAQGNRDLSSRTEQAASSLEQTASSLEQITATVKQTADSARQANQLAGSAAEVAQKGGAVVGQVVHTMNDISQSSQRIADIISVIDGIAFQTNILALNAAVEAARAGEQGRGFAVVASEVRSLAGRSAQAAKEIKDLIGASVDKVQNGSRLVQEAGATMQEIVSSVQRVSDIIGEITAAAAEQSEGIAQVNVAVNQLDQMTQQNAALVEQSTAASESLREQAGRLAEAIGTFRTGPEAVTGAAAAQRGRAADASRVKAAGARTPGKAAPAAARSTAAAKPGASAQLSKPTAHPSALAKALPGPASSVRTAPARAAGPVPPAAQSASSAATRTANRPAAPTAVPAAPAASAPKALSNRSIAPKASPKPAANAEGEWESF